MLELLVKKLDGDIPTDDHSKWTKEITKTLKASNSIPVNSKQYAMNETKYEKQSR